MTQSNPRAFHFGENWRRFLAVLDDQRIRVAEEDLRQLVGRDTLDGCRFLDAGAGSGLSSLVARQLGAVVYSFDVDAVSVACAKELKRRFFAEDELWSIDTGSVLDPNYLRELGTFDVVYSWGVLHHTGALWEALGNIVLNVAPGGTLSVAIYNDQGWISRYWLMVKRLFNRNGFLRVMMIGLHLPYLLGGRIVIRALRGRLRLERGMSLWYDMLDWLGGYPFEVASPEAIVSFFEQRGFSLVVSRLCGRRHGCNEFTFRNG